LDIEVPVQSVDRSAKEWGRALYTVVFEKMKCPVVELDIQIHHVHLIVMVSPKTSISGVVGTI
jgi:REP element-mobilizing transposase RayT